MMCPNCRYTGTHHPACNLQHQVGGPMHHHHGRRGGGFIGSGYDYAWPYPVYVQCPEGWELNVYGQCQLKPDHKVGQEAQDIPYGGADVGSGTGAVPPGSAKIPSLYDQYGHGAAGGALDRASSNLGKGISDAAMWFGIFGLAIVGVIAYTAYKTDAPRHAADFGRSQLDRADESSRLAARMVVAH